MDVEGKVLSVVFWSSILRKWNREYSFTYFNHSFIAPAMYLLEKEEIPRINDETRRILSYQRATKLEIGIYIKIIQKSECMAHP